MAASVTDVMAIFRVVLQVIALLHERYQQEAMIELGAFLDFIFLPYLDNPHCPGVQKVAIIELLTLSLLKSASDVVHLYYSYDNSAKGWHIFEHLVQTLKSLIAPADTTRSHHLSPLRHRPHTRGRGL